MTPDELGEYFDLVHPNGRDGLVAMLAAYFDESFTHNPKDLFVLGGWLATGTEWQRFTREWVQILHEERICPPVFHMTDFAGAYERFQHYKEKPEKSARLMKRLISTIQERTIAGVAAVLRADLYSEIVARHAPSETKVDLRSPYFFCLMACLRRMAALRVLAAKDEPGKISCFFDHALEYRGGLLRFFPDLVRNFFPDFFIETKTSGPAGELVPLQAADILAYEAMKHVKNTIVGPEFRATRKSFDALLSHDNICIEVIDSNSIEGTFVEGKRLMSHRGQ